MKDILLFHLSGRFHFVYFVCVRRFNIETGLLHRYNDRKLSTKPFENLIQKKIDC